MFRPRADAGGRTWSAGLLLGSATAVFVVAVALGVTLSPPDRVGFLSVILGVAALAAGALAVGESGNKLGVSASFIVYVLAAAFLGARSAVIAAVLAELAATLRSGTKWRTAVCANLPPAVIPALCAAIIVRAAGGRPSETVGFYLAVALAGALAMVLSFALFASLRRLVFPSAEQFGWRTLLEYMPSIGLSVLVMVAGVGVTFRLGNAGIAFALTAAFAFSYMAHLLSQSQHRAEQYASLSWGVLAGLMRSLDVRDGRLARHSAAVARFARDIAEEVGMSEQERELAHTAGLLHDIGRFALSDRVFERGRTLTDEDWEVIWRHPELGADMLRDLGMYGPVAEIVLTHHERPDGRGYPVGLYDEEIPEIAKIIAVAEVYDTLTASDTYRTQMSSFEALTELRRVAGSQLAERYVEVLAGLLTGEGVEYRHADMADFDSELNMERRIREASGA